MDGNKLILLIGSHSKCVRNCTITCVTTVCCHCGLDVVGAQTPFAFHGTRPRRFLVLVGSYVCKVAALLARWRCPHCHGTFTDYPPFACPHNAYTLPQMTERAAKYVSNTSTSYRTGVRSANLPSFHEEGPTDESVPPGRTDVVPSLATMAHTSLFRWVTMLPVIERYRHLDIPKFFRGDAAFANPALHRLDAGGHDVKIGSEIGLERFQAQLSSTQMGNPGLLVCSRSCDYIRTFSGRVCPPFVRTRRTSPPAKL